MTNETMAPEDQELQEPTSAHRRIQRPTRTTTPLERPGPIEIPSPPTLGAEISPTPFQFLLPVVGALTSVVMMVVMRNGQPLFMLIAAVVFTVALVSGLGFAISSRGRAAKQLRLHRSRYLDYLERTRDKLREQAEHARNTALALHPSPAGIVSFIHDPERLWERRRSDADHLQARIGMATVPWFTLNVPTSESPVEPIDPILLREAEMLTSSHSSIEAMPATADLREAAVVAVIGPRERTIPMIRALVMQLTAHQLPEDLELAAAFPVEHARDWRGFDLLPHVHDPNLFDGPVPARRVAPTLDALSDILASEMAERSAAATAARRRGGQAEELSRLVVISDDHGHPASGLRHPDQTLHHRDLEVTVIHLLDDRLDEPDDVDIRIDLRDEATITHGARGTEPSTTRFTPEGAESWQLEAIARDLAARRTFSALHQEVVEGEQADIEDMLGIDLHQPIDLAQLWRPRTPADFLRVAFGIDDNGRTVHLDLKESAQQGMGPHGICIGATGSGKSEMLRTLILSLATAHSPEDLAMILIDYKGGAAFSPFTPLPHLAGLIDNLADDPQLTVRARASLQGEVVRRQQQLKDADSSPSITHYRELRRKRPDLPPMPHLFVVIDEFGELLTAEPDFIDLFLQIGRIGRSIGVHLLLSSQRIEGGKLRGLDTYLSYRLGLRTFSEAESQVVLGSTDAFHLPPMPGYGYLKVDTSVYQRFRAGYVSGPVPSGVRQETVTSGPRIYELPVYNGINVDERDPSVPLLRRPDTGRTLVEEVVAGLRADDTAVSPVWLPPLPSRLTLGQVRERSDGDPLQVVVGLEDDPAHQRQLPWTLDLTRSGGHVAIIGGPQTGRTTLLRTVAASLALHATPQQVAIYGMDLAGGGLRRIEGFPHVGGVATRGDTDRMRRLVEELALMLRSREQLFKSIGIDSMSQLRAMHAAGRLPQLASADIVLLVDGYGILRSDFEPLEDSFTRLMLQAASYGLHLVISMGRWGELRMAHQTLFGTRVELRLNDPTDSIIDRKLAPTIPSDTPGRALTDNKTLAQVALPSLEISESEDIGEALERLAQQVSESWSGPAAAPIRLLPEHLPPESLPDAAEESSVPLGLRQDTMDTALWDLDDGDQHLLVLGDAKCGKSTTLRTIARGLIERYTPEELAIAVVDPRGHVPGVIPDAYLAAHASSLRQAAGLASSIASELEARPSRSPEEKLRSPQVVLLIDDHDIISAGGSEPLAPLVPYLPAARDLGFHVVATRPVAGATRALYGPLLQSIRDTGGAILLMSGDRSEGQILPRITPEHMPPGRGRYIRRGEQPYIVQVADTPRHSQQP